LSRSNGAKRKSRHHCPKGAKVTGKNAGKVKAAPQGSRRHRQELRKQQQRQAV
jgi:hypothetical protein